MRGVDLLALFLWLAMVRHRGAWWGLVRDNIAKRDCWGTYAFFEDETGAVDL